MRNSKSDFNSTWGVVLLLGLVIGPVSIFAAQPNQSWTCAVIPTEHRITTDSATGVKVIFVTTDQAADVNLYFHDRSWLADGSMLVFRSSRTGRNELFGYIEATGEIVRLSRPNEPAAGSATAGKHTNSIYVVSNNRVYEWAVIVHRRSGQPSEVTVAQRRLADLPAGVLLTSSLNESADGRFLSTGYVRGQAEATTIVAIEKATGRLITLADVPAVASHIQFSWDKPDRVMFSRRYHGGDQAPTSQPSGSGQGRRARFWFADFTDRPPWASFWQVPGELVTHECWWTENRVIFCGGFREEESHVKVLDVRTGRLTIAGAGSWWASGQARELAKYNWWHAAGSPDGKWIAADNWHGDIVLFNGQTTREHRLTEGHRTYGSGAHPHVGWGPGSDRVVFASNQNGNPDVCIALVPSQWRR